MQSESKNQSQQAFLQSLSDTQEHKVSDTFFAGRRIDFERPGFYDDGERGVLRDGFVEF